MYWELKRCSIVPAGRKRGNEDGVVWFHLLAGASILCSSLHPPRLSQSKRLSEIGHPSDKLSLRLKGRKREALLSAVDWDPRLPSHIRSVCVCVHVGTEPIAELTPPPPLLQYSPLSRCSHGLHFCSEYTQNQINAAVPPSLSHTYTKYMHRKLHRQAYSTYTAAIFPCRSNDFL